jgi:hypothetical protein
LKTKKKALKIYFPWVEAPAGSFFFVPSVAPAKTREQGLKVALYHGIKATATIGTLNGLHGVLFFKKQKQRGTP